MKHIAPIMLLTFLFACQAKTTTKSNNLKTMMLKADGKIEVAPNEASFNIMLQCKEKTASETKKFLVEQSNKINKQLVDFGIKQENLTTHSISINKDYTYINGKRVFNGFTGNMTLDVTVENLVKLESIYGTLLDNELISLGSLRYNHSNIDSLKNEAYVLALANANILADKLLQKLPETEKDILQIGNVQLSSSVNQVERANLMNGNYKSEDESTVNISIGKIEVVSSLNVEYGLR